ncbi:MAG: ABC transporter permease [Anaerovoracaceae bacterium]|jgi:putative ABC transport system permease protein
MYIFRNALKNIRRSKGRSILFGVIIFIIALAACLALSIRQSAVTTRQQGLNDLSITANITLDMDEIAKGSNGQPPSKGSMKQAMRQSSLSLNEQQKYAKLSSVKDFYYTGSVSVDAKKIDAVTAGGDSNGGAGGRPGGMNESSSGGDFTITGYSSDTAMTDFADGTSSITSGRMFSEGTSSAECIISSTLAEYNSLSVGDTITLRNPSDTSKTFKVKIVGIYKASSTQSDGGGSGMMPGNINNICMSYTALKKLAGSADLTMNTRGTYTFASYSDYKKFKSQAAAAGLDDKYTVESRDISNYLQQLQPLNNLSKYAKYFLIVLLAVGAAILIALNLFQIRGRKYEIGVLAAIGMHKRKISRLFFYETAVIAICAIIAGGIVGSLTSVPVTNALLSAASSATQNSESFDRGPGQDGGAPQQNNDSSDDAAASTSTSDSSASVTAADVDTTSSASNSSGSSSADANSGSSADDSGANGDSGRHRFGGPPAADYIDSVTSAANLKVIFQLLVIGLGLILVSGGAAVAAVTRCDPLEILTHRD